MKTTIIKNQAKTFKVEGKAGTRCRTAPLDRDKAKKSIRFSSLSVNVLTHGTCMG